MLCLVLSSECDLCTYAAEAGGGLWGAIIIINRRRAHAQDYSSSVYGSGASVHPENASTYSADNGG